MAVGNDVLSRGVEAGKNWFFDRAAVLEQTDRATARALSRMGAFVRQRARSSIRKRKRVADPGSPPSSHAGLVRDLLFFAYDPGKKSTVVGPAKLNSSPADPPVPHLLEFGGSAVVRGVGSRRRGFEYRVGHYRPHPYMGPALAAEQDKFPEMFRGSVRG